MKVIEKGTNRRAEVHIYVEGKVPALAEYGEYIDPKDKAICCYVAVDEDHKPRLGGRFSGTTLTIAYDAIVDGVLRKASSYVAKSVHDQKHKRIDVESFLYKTDKGIIDTEIMVAPLLDVTTQQGDAPETIGTMEMRLYITRQFDVFHPIGDVDKYYTTKGNIEDLGLDEEEHIANYKLMPPTFRMTFEKNCAPLGRLKVGREQRRVTAPRPGTEPWATFRFHYRSKEAITEREMNVTFDPLSKEKTEPHGLVHHPVPPLLPGTKPYKNDGDTSTRTSSPMPPDTPSTPAKVAQSTSKTSSTPKKKKPGPKPKSTPIPKMITTTEKETSPASETSNETSPESSPSPGPQENGIEDLRAKVFSKPTEKPTATEKPAPETDKAATNGDADSVISTSTADGDANKPTDKPAEKPAQEPVDKVADKPVHKPAEKEPVTVNGTITATVSKDNIRGLTEQNAARASSPPDPSAKPANGTAEKSTVQAKETAQKPTQATTTLPKKPIAKPTPISTAVAIAQKKPATPPPAVTPAKRSSPVTNGATPESKRAKVVTGPIVPSTQPLVPRIAPRSPTPKAVSVERQLAEQRKKLEELRKRRLEVAKKQAAVDEHMAPYKQRVAEELERLNQEMMNEEMAYTEEEQHYSASVEILQEFKNADGRA